MKSVVVDTSAVIRLYVPDGPQPKGLVSAVRLASGGECLLHAPELLLAEAAEVLRKKVIRGLLTQDECDDILAAILNLPLEYSSHKPLLIDAVAAASSLRLTVYDALFLVLAKRLCADFITADAALAKAWASQPAGN